VVLVAENPFSGSAGELWSSVSDAYELDPAEQSMLLQLAGVWSSWIGSKASWWTRRSWWPVRRVSRCLIRCWRRFEPIGKRWSPCCGR